MAIRQTKLVIKNNSVPSAPFSGATLLKGEAIVNTADGILMFSGVTLSTSEWTPAGPGGNATFFEVGSNLYDLKIRNQITAYSGVTNLSGKFLSGTTTGFVLSDITNIQGVDRYVTGSTLTSATDNTNSQSSQLSYNITPSGGPYFIDTEDTFTTGGTYDNNTSLITFDKNNGTSYTVDLSSIDVNDTYVTGFTYNPSTNTFTIDRNQGEPQLTAKIDSVTGLTISTLGSNRVVYTTASGQLTTESGFEYNQTGNTLTVGNINVQNPSGTTANIGQGGLVIGSGGSLLTPGIGNLIVHGDLTVFGSETIVATTELYVEDPQISLNYNPTGSTIATSVSSGIRIQDGNGIASGDTYLTIGQMQNLVSGDTSEYTGLTGYNNRGWVTQLNDIVIRNTNLNEGAPDGVRVLAEGDILDGGNY